MRKKNGFTLLEMLVVLGVFSTVILAMLSTVTIASRTLRNMENQLMFKNQYGRSIAFIANTIRRNEEDGRITIENGGKRLKVELSGGEKLHYFLDNKRLLMYIGGDDVPGLSDDVMKSQVMVLAHDVEDILFEWSTEPGVSRLLTVTYSVDSDKDGTLEEYIDGFNVYVSP